MYDVNFIIYLLVFSSLSFFVGITGKTWDIVNTKSIHTYIVSFSLNSLSWRNESYSRRYSASGAISWCAHKCFFIAFHLISSSILFLLFNNYFYHIHLFMQKVILLLLLFQVFIWIYLFILSFHFNEARGRGNVRWNMST